MASTSQMITVRKKSNDSRLCQTAIKAMESEYVAKLEKYIKTTPVSEIFLLTENLLEAVMKRLKSHGGEQTLDEESAHETIFQLINQQNPKIVTVRNKSRLFVKAENDNYKMIVPLQDMFGLIWEAHQNYGHPQASDLFTILHKSFTIPRFAIDCLYEVCTLCLEEAKPYDRCSLDLIPMTLEIDYAFTHIMVYEDLNTGYKHIRPFSIDTAPAEICMSLLRIFMDFGPPQKIFISDPIFKVPIEQVKQLSDHSSLDIMVIEIEANKDKINSLIQRIKKWMTDNSCKHWSLGCYILQLELNNEVNGTEQKTPFCKVFRSLQESDLGKMVEEDTSKTYVFTEDSKGETVFTDEVSLPTTDKFIAEEEDPLAI